MTYLRLGDSFFCLIAFSSRTCPHGRETCSREGKNGRMPSILHAKWSQGCGVVASGEMVVLTPPCSVFQRYSRVAREVQNVETGCGRVLARTGRTKLISFLRNYPCLNSRFQELFLVHLAGPSSLPMGRTTNWLVGASCFSLFSNPWSSSRPMPLYPAKATYQSHKHYQCAPQHAKDSTRRG
jgi:hypothetical protein